jgi:hypothetical protein
MKSKDVRLFAFAGVILVLLIAETVLAQESTEWKYSAAFYVWMPDIDGTVGALGRNVPVDASFSDLIRNTKFGVMSGIRAKKDRLVISGDFIYVRLESELDLPPVQVNVNPVLIEGDLGYEVAKNVEVYGGARILSVENTIQIKAPINVEVGATKTWVDPVVGIRLSPQFSDRWSFIVRADIGGFGAGSELTYQVQGYAVLHLTGKAGLAFGYRLLDIDYTEDGGDQFVLDMQIKGPSVGFIYKF